MHYVLDTSYLVELFSVDGRSDPEISGQIRERFERAINIGATFYVPVPVLFELCNHVAAVNDGGRRRQLAEKIHNAVTGSLKNNVPWTITPTGHGILDGWSAALEAAVHEFHQEFSANEIGLTDIAVIHEARRLHALFQDRPQPRPHVHIWTNDRPQKAHEPDNEVDPLMW